MTLQDRLRASLEEPAGHSICSGQGATSLCFSKSHPGSLQDEEFGGRQLNFKMNLFIHPIQPKGLFYKKGTGKWGGNQGRKQNQGRFWMMTLKSPTASREGGVSRGEVPL